MPEESGTETEDATEVDESTGPDETTPRTYTQEQVEQMIKDRLSKTKAQHAARVNSIVGDRKPEEVTAILEAHDADVEARKDEHTKALEAAAKAQAEAEAAKAVAASSQLRSEVLLALLTPQKDDEGNLLPEVNKDYLETVLDGTVDLALAAEDDEDRIASAIAGARAKFAPMFTTVGSESSTEDNGSASARPAPAAKRTLGESNQNGKSAADSAIDRFKASLGR